MTRTEEITLEDISKALEERNKKYKNEGILAINKILDINIEILYEMLDQFQKQLYKTYTALIEAFPGGNKDETFQLELKNVERGSYELESELDNLKERLIANKGRKKND
jgi:hypothetical protein